MTEKNTTLFAKSSVGVISQFITWPLEYYKILKQLPSTKTSLIPLLRQDINRNGYKNIYRSLTPQLISASPRSIVRFSVYEYLKKGKLGDKDNKSNIHKFTIALVAGGVEGLTVMTPAEVLKVKIIDNKMTTRGAISQIYKNDGIFGFWRGGIATTLRQSTTQGISLFIFEKFDPIIKKKVGNNSSLLTGIIGGVVAVYINNPIDVVKTYHQSGNKFKKMGIRGLYNGALLRSLRVAPLHGITYFIYDKLK